MDGLGDLGADHEAAGAEAAAPDHDEGLDPAQQLLDLLGVLAEGVLLTHQHHLAITRTGSSMAPQHLQVLFNLLHLVQREHLPLLIVIVLMFVRCLFYLFLPSLDSLYKYTSSSHSLA